MPEPQIEKESNETEGFIEESKQKQKKEQILLQAAEQIPVDLDAYNFDAFIAKMRHESCKPVLESIKKFIKVFLDKLPTMNGDEMVDAYRSFYSVIKVKCMQAEAWSDEGTSALERSNALEGLESLIMNQLHDRVLSHDASERDLDNFMERKMALHAGWIQIEHLDVDMSVAEKLKEFEDSWMSTAVTEFQKMSVYRTPRDKLVCALNGCRILNSLTSGSEEAGEMSADDFLPILIYTLIRANPPQLYSNINYVSKFRAPERISGETAYFFTHLMAAAEFIEKMDRSALKIEDEAYETFMTAAVEEFNHRPEELSEGEGSLEASINEKLDIAEAKAEEIFLKAKEAFKVTGERANQAFSNFKESSLAKKSMEKFNRFISDLKTPPTTVNDGEDDANEDNANGDDDKYWEDQLSRAVKMSLNEGEAAAAARLNDEVESEKEYKEAFENKK